MPRIKRNYSQPFFSSRRRNHNSRMLFIFGLLFGLILAFTYLQFDHLQLFALDMVGMAPTPTPFASEYATQGTERFAAGEVDAAAVFFQQAVQAQPENISYLYEYGRILIFQDRYDEALTIAEQAMQIAANDPRGYAIRALALMWSEPTEAILAATAGLERDDNFAPLHAALAVSYTNIGRFQEGLRRGARAVELDPFDPDTHRSYSIPLIIVGRNQDAIRQLEQAVEINPNLTAPYFELAGQYKALDQDEMAVAIYREVLNREPENAKAYLRLCETYSKVGEFQTAQGYCEEALDIDPEYASAYRELGRMQYNRRNYEGAIESFEECVGFGSTDIECYYLRGLAHYWLAQCDDAWAVLLESLDLAQALSEPQPIVLNIQDGLIFVTQNCPGYQGHALPTAIPPTPIPPTPIGG